MGYRIHSIYQRVPTRLLVPLKLGGVRTRLLRQESRKGRVDTMGVERDIGREPRSDAVRVVYGISAFDSNAMKSPNPHSGIYVAETARTLDLNGGNPACNQGGVLVLERKCYAVDCRNGTINECVNGTLQSKEQGYNTNSNNVVLVSSS